MDYKKYQFTLKKKKAMAKKKQRVIKVKETKFRVNTDHNDYFIKIRNIKKFLQNGNKVKITICFKGREIIYKEKGMNFMKRICDDLNNYARIDNCLNLDSKVITTIAFPLKRKKYSVIEDDKIKNK